MKYLAAAAATALCAACAVTATAQMNPVRVVVNGQPIAFEGTQPRMVDGRVLVPLRGVLEDIGAAVDWRPATQTVIATKAETEIDMPIGSRIATVNGRPVTLSVPAVVIDGRTMVPLRFMSEALGARVRWSGDTDTVRIATGPSPHDTGNYAVADGASRQQDEQLRNSERHAMSEHRSIVIPANTVIPVTLDRGLSSDQSSPGQRFTATLVAGPEAYDLPEGTRVDGVVREAIPAHNGRPGVLSLDFERIVFPGGDTRHIDAGVIALDHKYVTRTDSGRLVAKGGDNGQQWKWVGIGAGAGLLVSSAARGNQLLDTLLGGGAGYLYSQLRNKGARNVNLDAGTRLGVDFNRSFAFSASGTAQGENDRGP